MISATPNLTVNISDFCNTSFTLFMALHKAGSSSTAGMVLAIPTFG